MPSCEKLTNYTSIASLELTKRDTLLESQPVKRRRDPHPQNLLHVARGSLAATCPPAGSYERRQQPCLIPPAVSSLASSALDRVSGSHPGSQPRKERHSSILSLVPASTGHRHGARQRRSVQRTVGGSPKQKLVNLQAATPRNIRHRTGSARLYSRFLGPITVDFEVPATMMQ